jgi:hypothetical protein
MPTNLGSCEVLNHMLIHHSKTNDFSVSLVQPKPRTLTTQITVKNIHRLFIRTNAVKSSGLIGIGME